MREGGDAHRVRSHSSSSYGGDDAAEEDARSSAKVALKVAMIGDSGVGKTSLMVRYVQDAFTSSYAPTTGVNFMEKTINIGTRRRAEITVSIWDLGGQEDTISMLPLVCDDAVVVLYVFDLSRPSSLNAIKEWYRQARAFSRDALPFLVGTKWDVFQCAEIHEQHETNDRVSVCTEGRHLAAVCRELILSLHLTPHRFSSRQALRFAKAMQCPLIYTSTLGDVNVRNIYKIVIAKAFGLECGVAEVVGEGEPILLYRGGDLAAGA